MELNENTSSFVAMKGNNCVAIATNCRLGVDGEVTERDKNKLLQYNPRLFVGFVGKQTDIKQVADQLTYRKNVMEFRGGCELKPNGVARVLSSIIVDRRRSLPGNVKSVLAGLDPINLKPYIAKVAEGSFVYEPPNFIACGSYREVILQSCKLLWYPSMDPEMLCKFITATLMQVYRGYNTSQWGFIVKIIEANEITEHVIKMRTD